MRTDRLIKPDLHTPTNGKFRKFLPRFRPDTVNGSGFGGAGCSALKICKMNLHKNTKAVIIFTLLFAVLVAAFIGSGVHIYVN